MLFKLFENTYTGMIRCIVVDDEPLAVHLLQKHIDQLPFLQLQSYFYNPLDALEYLKTEKVDLIFIDINLPLINGMQLASMLRDGHAFIFTTAYSQYAVESYEKNAVDYLLKPITFDRFYKSVQKAATLLHDKKDFDDQLPDKHLFVKTGKALVQLRYDEILFFEGLKDYVNVYTQREKHTIYKRMKELEERLPEYYSRVHLSYIVNRKFIRRIEDNHVFIENQRIPISAKYKDAFLQLINRHLL